MTQINHDPNEPKIDRSDFPWWAGWVMLGFLWFGFLYFRLFEFYSLMLGIGTGGMLACWAIEITGNKVPDSWRKKR